MSYIRNELVIGEYVELEAKPHKIRWLNVILISSFASFMAAACLTMRSVPEIVMDFRNYIVAAFFVVWGAYSFFNLFLSETVVTNRRVVLKTGLIRSTIKEMALFKVDSVEIRQSFLGRICNYGTVYFSGSGVTKKHFFGFDMRNPKDRDMRIKFVRVINPQLIKNQVDILLDMVGNK